jgi:2-polyprenyl-3-methyl-5-hydroxy-6-metoxy-1,4-benzoquinol methylase
VNSVLSFIERYVRCPLCDSRQIIPAYTLDVSGTRLAWDRCKACSLVFQNPRLSESAISTLYSSQNYFGRQGSSPSAAYMDYLRYDRIRIAQSRRRMRRIIDVAGVRGGRLLDVGSASGFFGVAAQEAGFDVACIEPDATLAAYGIKEYGLTFLINTLEHCSLGSEQYEVITLWGTNSVLLHPLHSFAQLVTALKPGGVLAMNTQDFDQGSAGFFHAS